jgi:hypothetical protein
MAEADRLDHDPSGRFARGNKAAKGCRAASDPSTRLLVGVALAMATGGPPEEKRCTAICSGISRTEVKGQRCRQWLAFGTDVCKPHGASSPNARRAAERRRQEEAAREAVVTYGLPLDIGPTERSLLRSTPPPAMWPGCASWSGPWPWTRWSGALPRRR